MKNTNNTIKINLMKAQLSISPLLAGTWEIFSRRISIKPIDQ
jgi:hypothetical protein